VVRVNAIHALSNIGPDPRTAAPALAEAALKERDQRVWRVALDLLSNTGAEAKEAVPALAKAAADKNRTLEFRQQVLDTLAALGPAAKEAVPVLIELLKDRDLQRAAAAALAKVSPERLER
jgi:HEAT repeat protein